MAKNELSGAFLVTVAVTCAAFAWLNGKPLSLFGAALFSVGAFYKALVFPRASSTSPWVHQAFCLVLGSLLLASAIYGFREAVSHARGSEPNLIVVLVSFVSLPVIGVVGATGAAVGIFSSAASAKLLRYAFTHRSPEQIKLW